MKTAIEARLGPIERVHRVRKGLRQGRTALAVASLTGAGVALALGGAAGLIAYTAYGPLLVGRWATPPVIAGVGLAVVGAGLAWRAWRTSRLRIRLHSGGLAIVRGRRGRGLAWDDVLTIWSRAERTGVPGLAGSPRLRLEIEDRHGDRLRLGPDLEDFEPLATEIKSRVYPPLLAAYTTAFNDGQALAFGPLRLSRQGIADRKRPAIAWPQVSDARLEAGRLRIATDGNARPAEVSIPAYRIPNVELCLQLIQEIRATP